MHLFYHNVRVLPTKFEKIRMSKKEAADIGQSLLFMILIYYTPFFARSIFSASVKL